MISFKLQKSGVVAELEGKYWGIQYEDGQVTEYGYGPIENAELADPRYCKKPTDLTYPHSGYVAELQDATLRTVNIETTYQVT